MRMLLLFPLCMVLSLWPEGYVVGWLPILLQNQERRSAVNESAITMLACEASWDAGDTVAGGHKN